MDMNFFQPLLSVSLLQIHLAVRKRAVCAPLRGHYPFQVTLTRLAPVPYTRFQVYLGAYHNSFSLEFLLLHLQF